MYCVNFFKTFCFVILIYNAFCGQSSLITDLEDSSICGLSKKQIIDALTDSVKSIAIDPKCLEDQVFKNDRCLIEQKKLIECLHKEFFLTNEELKELTGSGETTTQKDAKLEYQKMKERSFKLISEANAELDIVVKIYQETIVRHLKSIDSLKEKIICVDDTKIALTNVKAELATALRQQVMDNIKSCRLGVYHTECGLNQCNSSQT